MSPTSPSNRRKSEHTSLSHALNALRTAVRDKQLFPAHREELRAMLAEVSDMCAEHDKWKEIEDFGETLPEESGVEEARKGFNL